jgi:phosphoglycerate dehydrogenase-like enzyme
MTSTSRPKIVVLAGKQGLPDGAAERVADLADVSVSTAPEQLPGLLPDADALFAWDFKARDLQGVWSLAPRVRWLQVAAAGVDAFMFPELVESDVVVTNARGVFDAPLAEYALALMLYFAKRLDLTVAAQREHRWTYHFSDMLDGRTLVIVGMGSIGRALAARARALGMRVIGVTRSGTASEIADVVYPVSQLHRALAEADYVVLLTPRTPETRGLFNRAAFDAMRPDSVLVNVGRGNVVDEDALLEVLRTGKVRVATDVFAQEPLPSDSPLYDAPNHLLSPHVGGDDFGSPGRILDIWADNTARFMRGEPLTNLVDKRLGY